jgi:hypothetical protein
MAVFKYLKNPQVKDNLSSLYNASKDGELSWRKK